MGACTCNRTCAYTHIHVRMCVHGYEGEICLSKQTSSLSLLKLSRLASTGRAHDFDLTASICRVNWPLWLILFRRVRHSGQITVPALTYRFAFGLGVYPGRMYCQASPSELTRSTLFRNRNLVVVPCLSAHLRPDSRVGKIPQPLEGEPGSQVGGMGIWSS
jgi:hypothetical protein